MSEKRAIYAVSGIEEWVWLAQHCETKWGWKPIYWIAPPKIAGEAVRCFPDSIAHEFFDAARGRPAYGLSGLCFRALDDQVLGRYRKYEDVAYRLMNRMDSGHAFEYGERRSFYLRQLMYWLNVVECYRPEVVLFSETPHFVCSYLLYAICRELGIQTVMYATISMPALVYVRSRVEDLPFTREGSPRPLPHQESHRLGWIGGHLRTVRGDYETAEPWYMKRQKKMRGEAGASRLLQRLTRLGRWPHYAAVVLRRIAGTPHVPANYMKQAGRSPESSTFSPREWSRYKQEARRKKRQLRKRYSTLSSRIDMTRPYVYLPLHYQPERTSTPEGGVYGDQWLLANLVSRSLPQGWRLVVKEHPSQFHDRLLGHLGRSMDFYDRLLALGNVSLASVCSSSFAFIDKAKAVATLTGTAGWEALVRGTPVLVFGNAWYRACKGAFIVQTADDCEAAMARIQAGYRVDEVAVEAYAAAFARETAPAVLGPTTREGAGMSEQENLESLVWLLDEYMAAR